jgi:ABC-type branched-subunit amino acid transport system substrate-binding protein
MAFRTDQSIKIGVLFSCSGYTSVIEKTQLQGTLLAVEEVNDSGGVNGRPLEVVYSDPKSATKEYAKSAHRMIVQEDVQFFFGCYTSASRKLVIPVLEKFGGLLWYPTIYEGFEYSPNAIYSGAAPNQSNSILADTLVEKFGCRVALVGADYIYPRESNRTFKTHVISKGGEIVFEEYAPLGASRDEFRDMVKRIKSVSPDFVFSTLVGDGIKYFYQEYYDQGFSAKVNPIASLTTSEAELRQMGNDVGENHISCCTYFSSIQSTSNQEFLEALAKRYGTGAAANMCLEAAYSQIKLFSHAAAQCEKLDFETVRDAVLSSEIETPHGSLSIDPYTGHANLHSRLGRVGGDGTFNIIGETKKVMKPDPFLVEKERSPLWEDNWKRLGAF